MTDDEKHLANRIAEKARFELENENYDNVETLCAAYNQLLSAMEKREIIGRLNR